MQYVLICKLTQINGQHLTSATHAAAVVFGVHLSAMATFRLDRKPPAIRPYVYSLRYAIIEEDPREYE